MTPSFTVPPVPHCAFSCFAKLASSSPLRGTPVIKQTPFPFLPFVCLLMRTTPSLGVSGLDSAQLHLRNALPQREQFWAQLGLDVE